MTEAEIQKAVASYLDSLAAQGRLFWFHCPNSIWTSQSQAGKHKSYGMKAGIPDCVIALPDGHTIYIELKTTTGRLQPPQKAVHAALGLLGHSVFTIYAEHGYDAKQQIGEILDKVGANATLMGNAE